MKTAGTTAATRVVACETCLAKVRESEAIVRQAGEHLAYFCSPECCEKWEARPDGPERRAPATRRAPAPAAEGEIQLGGERGRAKDERTKRLLRQHPQRDEPLIDSVEPDDTP